MAKRKINSNSLTFIMSSKKLLKVYFKSLCKIWEWLTNNLWWLAKKRHKIKRTRRLLIKFSQWTIIWPSKNWWLSATLKWMLRPWPWTWLHKAKHPRLKTRRLNKLYVWQMSMKPWKRMRWCAVPLKNPKSNQYKWTQWTLRKKRWSAKPLKCPKKKKRLEL